MAYNHDDFLKAANESGLYDSFSQYDLDLALKHPEAGLSILNAKKDYQNATTDHQRILANEMAEQIRKSYGNYTGGADGSGYISTGKYANQLDDTLDKIGSFGSFSYDQPAPVYDNQYAAYQQSLLDDILNRQDFSYSKESDPQWSSYKKSYLREGERATANTLAQTSAASGGRPSSYAVNAATQAGDYYAGKLNDVIPTLYQQAYDRYLNEYNMKLSDLGAVNTQEQFDYRKYLDDLGQYNNDRNFAYNSYLNDYEMLSDYYNHLQGQDETEYSRNQDQINRRIDEQRYQEDSARWDKNFYLQLLNSFGSVLTPEQAEAIGMPVGASTMAQSNADWEKQQADKNFYLELLHSFGSVLTPEQAEAIGMPVGAPTMAQSNADWEKQQAEAKFEWEKQQAQSKAATQSTRTSGGGGSGGGGVTSGNSSGTSGNSSGTSGNSSGTSGNSGEGDGIIDTMLGLGDDYKAYEYLVKNGFSVAAIEKLWEFYETEKAAQSHTPVKYWETTYNDNESGSEGDGIIDAMLGFGDDNKAYEYLVKSGFSVAATEKLWEFYEVARDEMQPAIENKRGNGQASASIGIPAIIRRWIYGE